MIRNIAAYRFVAIADPPALAASLRGWAEAAGLRGTVLVAPEGINLFLAGTDAGIAGFLRRLRGDARLAGIVVKDSWSQAVPFARLKVKLKREIISFRRDDASPLRVRAPAVAPADLARWLQQGHDDGGRRVVMLDTRNREETAHGAFAGALVLPIDNFPDLLPDANAIRRVMAYHLVSEPIATADMFDQMTLLTLRGAFMRVTRGDGTLIIDGRANIIVPDVQAVNGMIHVIDAVLVPPDMRPPELRPVRSLG